jgi:hypothetical protein
MEMENRPKIISDNERLQQLAKEKGIMDQDLKLPGLPELKQKASKLDLKDLKTPELLHPKDGKPEEINWDNPHDYNLPN